MAERRVSSAGSVVVGSEQRYTAAPPRPWGVWDLDMELRYRPVVAVLPPVGSLCEVGPGSLGLAAWTPRSVIGIEPNPEPGRESLPNLRLLAADGTAIPLPDRSVAAALAVDTLEHISPARRPDVVREMKRITAAGGRVILMGPTGPTAERGDRKVAAHLASRGLHGNTARWLGEHIENGLPTVEEILGWLGSERVLRVSVKGVFNLTLWYLMHLAAMEVIPRTGPLHGVVWRPFAAVARRFHRGRCYRQLVVADLGGERQQ